jgi:CRP-like cAMP-binding protein
LDKQSILERLDFYREAPHELQSTIAAVARYVRLAPGGFLFREGDASREFAAVGAGSIRVFRIGATGREITLVPRAQPAIELGQHAGRVTRQARYRDGSG